MAKTTYLINNGIKSDGIKFTGALWENGIYITLVSDYAFSGYYTTTFDVTNYKTLVFQAPVVYANPEPYEHYVQLIVGEERHTLNYGGYYQNNVGKEIKLKDGNKNINGEIQIGFYMYADPAPGVGSLCYIQQPTIYLISDSSTLEISKGAGISEVSGNGTHKINSEVDIDATVSSGYKWSTWTGDTDYLKSAANVKSNSVTIPDTNIALTANAVGNTYYISYNKNAAAYGKTDSQITGTMANSTHIYGTSKALTANAYSLTGYTFAGWNTKANGTGTSYANAASVNNLTTTAGGTITLYARWTPITYTVSFNSNGGTGTMSSITAEYDKSYNLTKNNFTKQGYVFVGWSTSANGNIVYNDQQTINNLMSSSGTIILYAVWVQEGIVYIYVNGTYKPALVYVYSNEWKMAQPYNFKDSWKICTN